MMNPHEFSELATVDNPVDAIAREACAEARHLEEAERYRNNPSPVGPPRSAHFIASEGLSVEGLGAEEPS